MRKPPSLFLWSLFFAIHLTAQKTDSLISIVAAPAKMNLLYIGVDNPIRIYAKGIPYDSLDITIDNGTISKLENYWYIARVTKYGAASIRISSKDNRYSETFKYGVLRIPDPVPMFSKFSNGDTLSSTDFKHVAIRIYMRHNDFNFAVHCNAVEYNVTQIGWSEVDGKKFVKTVKNTGANFNPEAKELMTEARSGDIFVFNDITAECPGDEKDRKLNSLVLFIR